MRNTMTNRYRVFRRSTLALAVGAVAASLPFTAYAQSEGDQLEEIVVVGSQIKGANISSALAVSVVDSDDIEVMGVDSGEELFQLIPENGQNFFNEAENISGGVNSARGDVGAFNLRNMGTGNTLVLLNGRRLVNSASYQTEEIGGSFVPVNTVNSNTIPVWGLERVEVLRDGASAIYGADAVAGVVNNVIKNDFEGFNIRFRYTDHESLPANRETITAEWGKNFNGGKTNVGVFFNYYHRDRISSIRDPRWANSDFRDRPDAANWEGSSLLNDTSSSSFGQFDVIQSVGSTHSLRVEDFVDTSGEFETYPVGDSRCDFTINATACAHEDGQGTYRHNYNSAFGTGRDLASDLDRMNLFVNITHQMANGAESFTELMYYTSESNLIRHASTKLSAVATFTMSADNPYNPLGNGAGRLSGAEWDAIMADVPEAGYDLYLDIYRFTQVPRIIDNDGMTYRWLQGFRGTAGEWDWETAISHSKALKEDITHNRVSNTLAQQALNSADPATAFNPFDPTREGSNIDVMLVDVYRKSSTQLTTFDIKASNNNLFDLPGGAMGGVMGFEWREESFVDDRDPRLDGSVIYTDRTGNTFPYISDVANSSPTPDSRGSRDVISLFAELQIPVLENLDVQVALRHEKFSDLDSDATVGKVAFGWRPLEQVLVRGSWSEAFRAPNLVTVNEGTVARSNTRTDWACEYANGFAAVGSELDCEYGVQRIAQGSNALIPETSENTSIGLVLDPIEGLTITADYWQITKDDTIGLFGEENHIALDLFYRLQAGASDCSQAFNAQVVREAATQDQIDAYTAAGLCPAGDVVRVDDVYVNLDTRELEGYDIGVYYDLDTSLGAFSFSYNGSFLEKYEQVASGPSLDLVNAVQAGDLPSGVGIDGFADLIGKDGNQDERHSARLSWRQGAFGAALGAYRIGQFYQGTPNVKIAAMTTYDLTADYRFDVADTGARIRLGVKNLTDERAPLADRYFGYFADAHNDYGRYMYVDLRLSF